MAWYRTGTITVTNGQQMVTGAGTDFVANARIGYGLIAPDGRTYEIGNVISATQISLASPYQGSTAGGQSYALIPTQSLMADVAQGASELIASFAFVRDGVGQGLFPDGIAAAPGVRFAADQDTGMFRAGNNAIGWSAGGVGRMYLDQSGLSAPGIVATGLGCVDKEDSQIA